MTSPDELTLGQLRRELRHLVALADTCERPKPTRINPAGHSMPGHEWEINQRIIAKDAGHEPTWLVRAVDDPEFADTVYVSTPDSMYPGADFIALPTEDARRLAMALLAAADRADHLTLGVPRIEDRRRNRKSGKQP